MQLYISTNLYINEQFDHVFKLLEKFENPTSIGIEIFPNWKDINFVKSIERNKDRLKEHPISLHGPYFEIEHSARKDTEEYFYAIEEVKQTCELAQEIGGEVLVFHHNNRVVEEENKQDLINQSTENLHELNDFALKYNVNILIENAGVKDKRNMLFEQDEFIQMALKEENSILLDIGHVHANGWDLEVVIQALANKITAYHLHNNNGYEDSHERILNGTLDFNKFEELYKKYTPNADLVLEYGYHLAEKFEEVADDIKYILKTF